MIAMLVVAGLCTIGTADAKAQSCIAETEGWGSTGTGYVKGMGGTFTTNCSAAGYDARIEVWLWGVSGNRTCDEGTFDAGRGSCVAQTGGDALAAERHNVCGGIWDGHARGFLITRSTGAWGTGADYPFGGMQPEGCEEEETGDCEPSVDPNCQGGNSPILIPLTNMQAFRLTSAKDGVKFDLNADGIREQTAWTRANAKLAFLAIDRNGNGTIDDGKELFGNNTLPGIKNGFDALSQMNQSLGAPLKGRIFEGDPLYDKLLLWEDRNHNGVSEAEELRPAKEIITVLGLGYSLEKRRDGSGNLMRYKGWAELRTLGPGQKKATDPLEHQSRLRDIFDVIFVSK